MTHNEFPPKELPRVLDEKLIKDFMEETRARLTAIEQQLEEQNRKIRRVRSRVYDLEE